ncbi:Ig-like domain-containing protein, partial [uncultured Roseivirga sp.]|uniref:Ig-like domain-containing protein n=1 Tax=uncultured Roseivirga sp. TaxID=543088 RepID=UPI0030DD611F
MVLNQPATFQFSGNYSNVQNAFSVIIKNVYNSVPSGGFGGATGLTYTTSGGKSGSANAMGTYAATYGPFIHTTDEVIAFSLAPSTTIASGETLTIPAGTVIQNLPGNYTAGQTFNAGPYTAVIANSAFDGVGATMIATPSSNTAPTIGGASAGENVNDNATISPFSTITITDADGDNVTATITLDNNAKGVITGANGGTGPYTMTSKTVAAMQTALRALVFNPTDNRTSTSETTTFTVVVNDGTVDATNNTTTVISSAVGPAITAVSIPNTTMKVGSVVTATITVTADADNYTSGSGGLSGTIGGFTLSNLSKTNNTTYTATFTVTEGGTDVAAGSNIPISVTLTDSGGKAGNTFTTAISQNADVIDANTPAAPSVPDLSAGSDTGASSSDNLTNDNTPTIAGTAESGSTVTLISSVDGSVGTGTATGGSYSITTNALSAGSHSITATAQDAAGNTSSSSGALSITIDTSAPTATVAISDALLIAGETATVTITFSEAVTGFTNADLTIANGTLSAVSSADGGTTWTATFTPT